MPIINEEASHSSLVTERPEIAYIKSPGSAGIDFLRIRFKLFSKGKEACVGRGWQIRVALDVSGPDF